MSKSTKKPLPPKRKRMKRPARLRAARTWLTSYNGKDVVRGYMAWFGVDLRCAVIELRLLSVRIDPKYAGVIKVKRRKRRPAQSPRDALPEGYGIEWDENFSFIAGFRSGGAPYGTPWEP